MAPAHSLSPIRQPSLQFRKLLVNSCLLYPRGFDNPLKDKMALKIRNGYGSIWADNAQRFKPHR